MTNQHDPNWYKDNQDYIKDLCKICGLCWSDYDGICTNCREINRRK